MLQFSLIGNLGGDAKLHDENGSKFVSFNVAHNDRWSDNNGNQRESITWVSCILNGDGGKVMQYLTTGRQVFVQGRGSVRTYHSPKLHQLVAGITINVDRLELIGGSSDEVPRMLSDETGVLHEVFKAYYLGLDDVKTFKLKTAQTAELFSKDGKIFHLDSKGWIVPVREQSQQGSKSDSENNSNQ